MKRADSGREVVTGDVPWDRLWFYRMVRATRRAERWPPARIRAAMEWFDPGWLCRLIEVSGWSPDEFESASSVESAWLVALDAEFGGKSG